METSKVAVVGLDCIVVVVIIGINPYLVAATVMKKFTNYVI